MPALYLMPSGKIATQAGKPVLMTEQQFFECCCWTCGMSATVQICCANGPYATFNARHTLNLDPGGPPYFYFKSIASSGELRQIYLIKHATHGWIVVLQILQTGGVNQTITGGASPFNFAYIRLRAASGHAAECPPAGTWAVHGCAPATASGSATECSCSINQNVIAYVNLAQQTCSCPAATLSITPASRNADQGASNAWTFTVANPTQLGIYFTVDWGDGTSSTATATGCNNHVSLSKTYNYPGTYTITATAKTSSTGSVIDTATATVTVARVFDFENCDEWFQANSGGYGGTQDVWTIPSTVVPDGTPIDIRFEAYSIPDKFIVTYMGVEVYNSGWRGSSSYEGDPLYPGGIAGPGSGVAYGIFTVVEDNYEFTVEVEGPGTGTAWHYDIRADCAGVGDGEEDI